MRSRCPVSGLLVGLLLLPRDIHRHLAKLRPFHADATSTWGHEKPKAIIETTEVDAHAGHAAGFC